MKPEIASLGKHLGTYKPKRSPQRILLGAGGVSFFIGAAMLTSIAVKLFNGVDLSSRVARDGLLINIILSAFAFGIAVILTVLYLLQMKNRVDLYEEGFVHVNWNRILIFRWEDVVEVYERPVYYRKTTSSSYHSQHIINYLYTVRHQEGQIASFGGLENVAQLGKTIKTISAERLFPQSDKTFQAGGLVNFGSKLSLSQEGISDGNRMLPWTETASIRVDSKGVTIVKKNNNELWKFIAGHQISNSYLLTKMIKIIKERKIFVDSNL